MTRWQRVVPIMPKVDTSPDAILEAVKKIDIVSELLDEKNKNNLKMIVEGKVSGGKQIGPYARLLGYDPGETIMREGEWGGNTFYLSVTGDLDVYVKDDSGNEKNEGNSTIDITSLVARINESCKMQTPMTAIVFADKQNLLNLCNMIGFFIFKSTLHYKV